MKCLYIVLPLTYWVATLGASLPYEATPWTGSYLETKVAASVERYSLSTHKGRYGRSPHTQYDGAIFVSSAPVIDWEIDAALFGRSLPTRKVFIRAERQLLSDIERSPVALTAVVNGSLSAHERSRRPVFFEMAKNTAEAGFGVGRHLFIRKSTYTQLFSYVLGGVGSSRARWFRAEVGLRQVVFHRHIVRFSYEWLKTYGHERRFRGMGTIRALCHSVNVSYSYCFNNGLEAQCSYVRHLIHSKGLLGASQVRFSVSLPISL